MRPPRVVTRHPNLLGRAAWAPVVMAVAWMAIGAPAVSDPEAMAGGGGAQAGTTADRSQLHRLLAQAEGLMAAGQFEAARGPLQQALVLAPDSLRAQGLMGVLEQVAGRSDAAKGHYARLQAGVLTGPPQDVELLGKLAAEVVWMINAERLGRHLQPLKPHPILALIATRHSEEMRDLGYFSHSSPDPEHALPSDRFREIFGFAPRKIGENIAKRFSTGGFSLTLTNLQATHRDLMNSPGHRSNILDADYTDLGVGLAANDRGDYWLTQVFVRFLR